MANLSLERIHSLCFNREVKLEDQFAAAVSPPNLVAFSDLRLRHPVELNCRVTIEYEQQPGRRSVHTVAFTCAARGAGGLLYLGGYEEGDFRIFRADCIHHVIAS